VEQPVSNQQKQESKETQAVATMSIGNGNASSSMQNGKKTKEEPLKLSTSPPTFSITPEFLESLQQKTKDEQIAILLGKLTDMKARENNNSFLFVKLQEELRQKEKQYEIMRGKQLVDQEGKKVAEERAETFRNSFRAKEEDCKAKDKHIQQLTKKLKQARKEWIASSRENSVGFNDTIVHEVQHDSLKSLGPSNSWQMRPEIDIKEREIKKLRDEIWAHQQQNGSLSSEVRRVSKEV
jgi:hypothetical protein